MTLINLAEILTATGQFERLSDTENAVVKNRENFLKARNNFILNNNNKKNH